jgi:cytochrome c553
MRKRGLVKKIFYSCFWILVFSLSAQAQLEAQVERQLEGHKIAGICINCHGEKGISPNALWPNLAGQKKEYLIKQLNAFQAGHRKDPMMSPVVTSLSKEDIQNVALYFSNQKLDRQNSTD